MADLNPIKAVGAGLVEKIFGSILWFGIAILIIVILGGTIWYFYIYKRKFDIRVKITSERALDRNKIIFDKAAILYDRSTKSKFFRIWNLGVDLPVPRFEVLQNTNQGDLLEIYRKSEDDFYFLTPASVDKLRIIKSDGKLYPIGDQEHKQVDADIAFWNVKRKNQNKKMFDTESLLMKILPWIPHIISGMLMIFILYILLDHLPTILGELSRLTSELRSLKGAEVTVQGLTWSLLS